MSENAPLELSTDRLEPPTTGGSRYLTDSQILACCHELLARSGVTGSVTELQGILRQRYNMAGKTTRVLRLWRQVRELPPPAPLEIDVIARAREQVAQAENLAKSALDAAEAAEERALLAEERERAHQCHWAKQIDDLRQRLNSYQRDSERVAELERRNLDLYRQVAAYQRRIAELENPTPVTTDEPD